MGIGDAWRKAIGRVSGMQEAQAPESNGAANLPTLGDVLRGAGVSPQEEAKLLFQRTLHLGRSGRFTDELALYESFVRQFGDSQDPTVRQNLAAALFNRGVRLGSLNRFDEEVAVYDDVILRFGGDSGAE